jgi:hypothetical protein
MKNCFKCGIDKPLGQFYPHPRMADGHLNKCKECTKKDAKEQYEAKPIARAEYEKRRNQTPHRKAKALEYQRTSRRRDPVKEKARRDLNRAVMEGRIVPQSCEACGATIEVEAHHDDYTKSLDVRWLCFEHHRTHHGQQLHARRMAGQLAST